ncbi:MAG: hypothetical protein R3E66_22760 [bacterium]
MRDPKLKELWASQGATFVMWRDQEVVSSFGALSVELEAATQGVAIADRNERGVFTGEGSEVVTLIQGLVTGDMHTLEPPGAGMVTTAVDLKGRLVADLRVFHMPDALIFDAEAEAAQAFLGHARRHVIMEDAKFRDRSATTCRLLILGPEAAATLDRVGRFVAPVASLRPYHATWGRVGPVETVLQATPDFGVPAFEIFCPTESAVGLVTRLLAFATPVGFDALETLRIQTGYPRWGVELDTKIIRSRPT